jgi:hypothetical protein
MHNKTIELPFVHEKSIACAFFLPDFNLGALDHTNEKTLTYGTS